MNCKMIKKYMNNRIMLLLFIIIATMVFVCGCGSTGIKPDDLIGVTFEGTHSYNGGSTLSVKMNFIMTIIDEEKCNIILTDTIKMGADKAERTMEITDFKYEIKGNSFNWVDTSETKMIDVDGDMSGDYPMFVHPAASDFSISTENDKIILYTKNYDSGEPLRLEGKINIEEKTEKTEQNGEQTEQEQAVTSVESSEVEQTGYEFTIGDAKIILPNDYGYEDYSTDSIESYMLYLEPEKAVQDFLLTYYFRNSINGQVTAEQAKNVTGELYPRMRDMFIEQIFSGSTLISEEPYEKNGEPAYHFVFSSTSMGLNYIHDSYFIMANQHDLLVIMETHWEDSKNDFKEEYREIIQNIETAGIHDDTSKTTQKEDTSSFTNKYGTPTTKCAHPGCNNYIAPSGDTNCCVTHSNRCADCGKYIDEDATYCMDCLTNAAGGSNSGGQPKTDSSSSKKSSKKCAFLENGVEVCNNQAEEGSPYCSYHKKLLDDAYNSLIGN